MQIPIIVPIHVSGRAHSNAMRYFRLAAKALIAYRNLSQIAETKVAATNCAVPLQQEVTDAIAAIEDAAVMPIILSAMCLESTLHDLGVCLYGEDFAARIDRLDPAAKFSVIKQLVDREVPSKGDVALQSIQALVTARNRLVHHKSISRDASNIEDVLKHAEKERQVQQKGIDASFRTLVLISASFDGNIFEELRILPSFKKKQYWTDQVPEALHADVQQSLAALERQRARDCSDTNLN
jgi:hypothetical protein